MGSILTIKFPKDFDKRYQNYKKQFPDSFQLDKATDLSVNRTPQRLILKEGEQFKWQGIVLDISTKTIYYHVLDILYSRYNPQDEFLSYEDIEKELRRRGYEAIDDIKKRNTRIRNAVTATQQGLFRCAKINGSRLENKAGDGKKIIRTMGGKGLGFHNPEV